jgi:hypothetical protein
MFIRVYEGMNCEQWHDFLLKRALTTALSRPTGEGEWIDASVANPWRNSIHRVSTLFPLPSDGSG